MRILSKGSELPFVHKSVGWDKSTNFKDYDIVFVNLRTLEEAAQDYDHPYNESSKSPKLLDTSDVSTFIKEDGYMVVYLPDSPVVKMGNTTTEKKKKTVARSQQLPQYKSQEEKEVEPYDEYELLDWLSFSVNINTDESGKSVNVVDRDWDWYFGNLFGWDKLINAGSPTRYETYSIAENSYGEQIATKVNRNRGGFITLMPPDDNISYSGFVRYTLQNVFNIESNVEGRAPPAWLSEYSLPKEKDIEDSIKKSGRKLRN